MILALVSQTIHELCPVLEWQREGLTQPVPIAVDVHEIEKRTQERVPGQFKAWVLVRVACKEWATGRNTQPCCGGDCWCLGVFDDVVERVSRTGTLVGG